MEFDIIHWAIPGFIILLLAELILSAYDQRDLYETKDTISSLTMGLGNVIIGIWGKLIVLGTFYLLYQIRIFTLGWEWYIRSEEHTSELQSRGHLVCRLLLEK